MLHKFGLNYFNCTRTGLMQRAPGLFVIAWALFCANASLYGQLNESDTAHFQIRISASGHWQRGNVDYVALRTRADAVWRITDGWAFKTQNASLYQSFSGRRADNDVNSRNYFYFKPQQRIYPFAMVYGQTNFRRQIIRRLFAGPGLTWQVCNKPGQVIKLSGSMVYESTRFKQTVYNQPYYNGVQSISLWRPTAYLAGIHQFQKLKLYYTFYIQPALQPVANNRIVAEAGIDMALWKGWSFTTQYLYSYEQVVVSNVKPYDRLLSFGFAYQQQTKAPRAVLAQKP